MSNGSERIRERERDDVFVRAMKSARIVITASRRECLDGPDQLRMSEATFKAVEAEIPFGGWYPDPGSINRLMGVPISLDDDVPFGVMQAVILGDVVASHPEYHSDDEYAEAIRKSYKRPRSKLAEGGVISNIVFSPPFGSPPNFPPFPPALAAAMQQVSQRSIR